MKAYGGWYGVFYNHDDGQRPYLMHVFQTRNKADRQVLKEIQELSEDRAGEWSKFEIKRVKIIRA